MTTAKPPMPSLFVRCGRCKALIARSHLASAGGACSACGHSDKFSDYFPPKRMGAEVRNDFDAPTPQDKCDATTS